MARMRSSGLAAFTPITSRYPTIVGKQVDLRLRDMEGPELAIMWIGGQNSRTNKIERSSRRGAPIIPRFVQGPRQC